LNVGVFTGISIYELKFKQVLTTLKEKIFANFGREVNVTGKLMQMAFDTNISRVTPLRGMHVILLMIMQCDGAMKVDNIAQDIGLFGDELEKFLAPLKEKKLIEALTDKEFFVITEQGKHFLAEIWPIVEQTNEQCFAKFTSEEKQKFAKFLQRIQDACNNIITRQER